MPRFMPTGLMEAMARPGARIATYGTLELFIVTGAETESHYFATATLNFGGVSWKPHLRKSPEFTSDMLGEADSSIVELQNVDMILGNKFARNARIIEGAAADVGRHWKDLERGDEWYKVFLTGIVQSVSDNQVVARLNVISDIYAGSVSVGPSRDTRRKCQAPGYKLFECGSTSDLPTCPRTFDACEDRHPGDEAFARNMGFPFQKNDLLVTIPK